MKPGHMLLCALLLTAGVVLSSSGVGGYAFVPLVACMAMMGGMMWMMTRSDGGDRGDR